MPPFLAPPFELGNVAGFRTGRLEQQHDGQALQWASEEMKGDRELCMAAVAQLRSDDDDDDIKLVLGEFGVPESVQRDALTK